jgi:heterodisulfide reductase subunit B
MRLGFYPGCSLEGSAREYAESLRAIAPLLGIDLTEVAGWNCCGASAAHSLNPKLALALPARVLALAEKAGFEELLAPCSACFSRLAQTQLELREHPEQRRDICSVIEAEVTGSVRILNALDIAGRFVADGLAEKITKPFRHKVACYYGCYLTRPGSVSSCKRGEDPQEMEAVLKAIGAEPIDWAFKVECCGAALSVTRTDLVGELSGRIVADAAARGAEAIIVVCPLCHTNLDLRRDAITRHTGVNHTLPVLYLSQAIGLALGLSERALGLHRHHVPVRFAAAQPANGTSTPQSPVASGRKES